MTTSELISYIRNQVNNNISKDLITSKLVAVGWRMEDINEGFSNVELELNKNIQSSYPKKGIDSINPTKNLQGTMDQYREPIEGDIPASLAKTELPKVKVFVAEKPKIEDIAIKNKTTESPKVWTPMRVPIKEGPKINSQELDIKEAKTEIIVQNQELQVPKEELIPTLIPKKDSNNPNPIKKIDPLGENDTIIENQEEKSRKSLINSLPKIAMISSFQSDLSSLVKGDKEEVVKKRNHKIMKWVILALLIIIMALATWVFASGYIDIEKINIPFIKKDPKTLLLNNSKVLSSLESYKTETNIEILSPSFSNITLGLLSGEAVISPDKDSMYINTLGIINQGDNFLSENSVKIKSSLFEKEIITNIKNNGEYMFVDVPDLSEVIEGNTPESTIVKINKTQFNLVPSLFSLENEQSLKKINLYKVLSGGVPSLINEETVDIYGEFINNVNITGKNEENIKGVNTYRYSINADKQLVKKLFSKISENFILNLPEEDVKNFDKLLGSITINSFDVWIGKEDNNIYQYNMVIDIPLSKIIGFEDKSIGDNMLNINWKTTYYDFNIPNDINIPQVVINAEDFFASVKEIEMKNKVYSFKKISTDLFNIENNYGPNPNKSGSCMEPSQGSLFSPLGHSKKAVTVISSISLFLNEILGITKNVGYCYSTSKAWSFTIPISSNYDSATTTEFKSFFCVDSTGAKVDLTAPPSGVLCVLPEES